MYLMVITPSIDNIVYASVYNSTCTHFAQYVSIHITQPAIYILNDNKWNIQSKQTSTFIVLTSVNCFDVVN